MRQTELANSYQAHRYICSEKCICITYRAFCHGRDVPSCAHDHDHGHGASCVRGSAHGHDALLSCRVNGHHAFRDFCGRVHGPLRNSKRVGTHATQKASKQGEGGDICCENSTETWWSTVWMCHSMVIQSRKTMIDSQTEYSQVHFSWPW